jgi:hypothetical protein
VTQGNQFGPKGGRWMTAAKLRALYRAGRTYDEIAEANERSEGWRPSRSAVLRKLQSMELPARNSGHKELLPWRVSVEHNGSLIRRMLSAESRRRQGLSLSVTDKKLIRRLDEVLFGRGTLMVVTYHPESGFAFGLREDSDEDIIRMPESAASIRKDMRTALRDETDEELVETALRENMRPELLENAGRDTAADRLRRRQADAQPEGEQPEIEQTGASAPPRRARAR